MTQQLFEFDKTVTHNKTNSYTITETGSYIATSFQQGSYPIRVNGTSLGTTRGKNGCVCSDNGGGYYLYVYLLNLKENDVVSTSLKDALISLIKIK